MKQNYDKTVIAAAKVISEAINEFRLDCNRLYQNMPYKRDQFEERLISHGCNYIKAVMALLIREQIIQQTPVKHPNKQAKMYLYSFLDTTKPVVWSLFAPVIDGYRKRAAESKKKNNITPLSSEQETVLKLNVMPRSLLVKLVKSSDIAIEELFTQEEVLQSAISSLNEGYIVIERK